MKKKQLKNMIENKKSAFLDNCIQMTQMLRNLRMGLVKQFSPETS